MLRGRPALTKASGPWASGRGLDGVIGDIDGDSDGEVVVVEISIEIAIVIYS